MEKIGELKFGGLLKSSAWSAMAAALALMALPAEVLAQNRERGGWRGDQGAAQVQRGGSQRATQSAPRAQPSAQVQRGGGSWRGNQGAAQVQRGGGAAAQTQHSNRGWRAQPAQQQVQQGQVQQRQVQQRQVQQRQDVTRSREARRGNDGRTWSGNHGRNWSGNDGYHGRHDRVHDRVEDRHDRGHDGLNSIHRRAHEDGLNRREHRSLHRNINREHYGQHSRLEDRHNQYHWNRDWRNDGRYDWRRHRTHNRNFYRLGRYYSPYHNHYYSRLSVGFFLNSMFYSNRYWIDDPWSYRLPAAHGPYRWIRYYDDALLVDIYTGEVVDVIHDFFW